MRVAVRSVHDRRLTIEGLGSFKGAATITTLSFGGSLGLAFSAPMSPNGVGMGFGPVVGK